MLLLEDDRIIATYVDIYNQRVKGGDDGDSTPYEEWDPAGDPL